jgi:hypothetical protein
MNVHRDKPIKEGDLYLFAVITVAVRCHYRLQLLMVAN